MRRVREMCKATFLLVTTVVLALAGGTTAEASCDSVLCREVYSEDFESDPGYDSLDPENLYWDPAGYYYANVIDVSDSFGWYIAYSPTFETVTGSFCVRFDFRILTPWWGCYPGVYFQNTWVPDPTEPDGYSEAFYADYHWSDAIWQKFTLKTRDEHYQSMGTPEPAVWYTFTIEYDHNSETADWTVVETESGVLFHQATDVQFSVSDGFNRLYIGQVTWPPQYGFESDINVDNIHICAFSDHVVDVDIKPGSCPNPINTKSNGVLPVAVTGSSGFDVSLIDPDTVLLEGVPALRFSHEDVATPSGGDDPCACNTDGPDGITDLTLKFNTQAVVEALGPVNDGDVRTLTLTGSTLEGETLAGQDCVVILDKGKLALATSPADLPDRTEQKATEEQSWGAIKSLYR
jgi:hypothetical protein